MLGQSAALPRKIWQLWLQQDHGPNLASVKDQHTHLISTWVTHNPSWTHRILDNDSAREFMTKEFHLHRDILRAWSMAHIPILQADLLRYLVLYIEGGVYADLDTECMKGVEEWNVHCGSTAGDFELLVGVEYDNVDGRRLPLFPDNIQFVTWTIAAKPRSQLLWSVICEIADNLNSLTEEGIESSSLTAATVMELTGPRAFTRALLRALGEKTGRAVGHADFTLLKKPTMLGGLGVLPVTAFACEQPHSNAGHWTHPDVLVIHKYHHSWVGQANAKG
ncbi:hypothetical protein LTS15_006119 [Exophiala xenobiotica]|nr:hypothetical protein LTS15_006119 [Exophiala xenobiotica]